MIITAWNPETDGLEKTFLTATAQSNANSFKVQNADRIPTGSLIMLGEMGMEQTEVLTTASGATNTTLSTTGNSKFSHAPDEPVYKLRYDKVMFYRSTAADGTYTLIATVDIDVDNRNLKTEYQDLLGSGTSFYKTKFINSLTSEETEFSDYISAQGYQKDTIGKVIDSVVRRVKDTGYTILSSEDYLDIASEVNNDIESQSERPYNFMRKPSSLDRVANQNYVDLPADFNKFYQLEYTSDTGGYGRTSGLKPISRRQFDSQQGISKSDYLRVYTIDESTNRLLLKPTPLTNGTGVFQLWYYTELAEFTELSQVVQTPNTLVYRYKFLSEYYAVKAETDPSFGSLATRYESKYGNELMKLQRSNRKDVGTERSFMDADRQTSGYSTQGKVYKI